MMPPWGLHEEVPKMSFCEICKIPPPAYPSLAVAALHNRIKSRAGGARREKYQRLGKNGDFLPEKTTAATTAINQKNSGCCPRRPLAGESIRAREMI